jgi:hypothetical protein
MRRLACSAHDRMVWDLALGRLSDAAAEAAEQARATCPTCAAWWREELEGDAVAAVELAVGAELARFSPPRRHALPWWLAAAAVLVLALALGMLTRGKPAATAQPPCCVAQVVQDAFQPNAQVDAQDLARMLQGKAAKASPRT